mgnify:CR=1 FL=1|tara:strand:+ start:168 stop:596 length:429 start_codon:yes stop_codon:yes gene_type:complete
MSTKKSIGQNMMLVSSSFRGVKSFNLISVTEDCPYVEGMFDPSTGILVMISKTMKETFTMLPRLDDNGQPQRLKVPSKETGKVHKEQRVSINTFSEFYITEKEEIENFLAIFSVNFADFDVAKYMTEVDANETKTSSIIMPA